MQYPMHCSISSSRSGSRITITAKVVGLDGEQTTFSNVYPDNTPMRVVLQDISQFVAGQSRLHVADMPSSFIIGYDGTYSSTLLKRVVTLTAADIKNLKAMPIQLVPAPGSNLAVAPAYAVLTLQPGSTPFTTTGVLNDWDISFVYPTGGFAFATDSLNFLTATNPLVAVVAPAITPSGNGRNLLGNVSQVNNKPLLIQNIGTDEFAAGDGTMTVTVFYSIVDIS